MASQKSEGGKQAKKVYKDDPFVSEVSYNPTETDAASKPVKRILCNTMAVVPHERHLRV